ncbi:glycoprotein 3-alpha-L-fucosyltransferase A-like isoform X2 [Watersipora subatra]
MNKLVWRFIKLAAVVLFTYFIFVQILYMNSQSKPPYKRDAPKPSKLLAHLEIPVQETMKHDSVKPRAPGNAKFQDKVFQAEKKRANADEKAPKAVVPPIEADREYINTLLLKPRQTFNFHHNVRPLIWPDPSIQFDDRIISQMTYGSVEASETKPKEILVYSGQRDGMMEGRSSFISQQCPVTNCMLTYSRSASTTADVILWQDHVSLPGGKRPPGQIWMVFFLESPYHTPGLTHLDGKVNWTATYRRDSTIVAPYERFTLFNSSVEELPLAKNYAIGKTKMVAWFVSNCGARNNRLGYAKELGKHIQVDIYGACGSMNCPRASSHCFDLLSTTYKFYLAFENSNCRDYITEKFFVNGLKNDVIPIVMGAHPDDYKHAAPKNSYIHVDDFESPQKLAEYLRELDKDDDKYNEYFRWKGTGDNLNTYFWCRVCAMAHAKDVIPPPKAYDKLDSWWRGQGVCKNLGSGLWPRW